MTDIWYYADGDKPKGPFSFRELIDALSNVSDLRSILVWHHGLKEWTAADQVSEIAAELFQPPPLPNSSIQQAPEREPSIVVEGDLQSKNAKKELTGIAGWLIIVGIGQIIAPLRMLILFGQYIASMDSALFEKFPVIFLGEAAINGGLVVFAIYTAVLFFNHSRKFPTFFIWEWILFAAVPFIDAAWVAFSMTVFTDRSPQFANLLDAKEIGTSIGTLFVGGIWIAYILRSKRVANTFIKGGLRPTAGCRC